MPPLPKRYWREKLSTMQVCLWYSLLTCTAIAVCMMSGGVGPRWEQNAESDIWHSGVAMLLVVSLAITELCIAVGGASNLYITESLRSDGNDSPHTKLPGAHDSWLTFLEYLAKLTAGAYMYVCSGGIAHADSLAFGGPRPVYIARFVQWSFAVPVLILITNGAFIESKIVLIQRSWASLFASFSYVWAAWLMEVTPHHWVRWSMLALSLAGAVFVSVDQLEIARENRSTACYSFKIGLLTYSKVMETFYAAIFLMGRFGAISPATEHTIYPYADATIKVFHGAILAMIRSREGALAISQWCRAAVSLGNDLKYLLHQAKMPTLTIDLSGNVVQWNESIARLTGLREASVYGKSLLALSEPSCRDDLNRTLGQKVNAFRAGTILTEFESGISELSIITETSEDATLPPVRRLAMTFVPKRNSAGDLEGITAIGQDLSEIADLKMIQERKAALMTMLGHELRSPLHGMMGLTSALMEDPESKPHFRQLEMMKGCSSRLLDLVDNVMGLAQSEKKRMDGMFESKPTTEVDLAQIVEEAIVMIGNAVDKANRPLLKPGVRLTNASLGTKIPLVRGDAYKCTQLVYNLMTNAAKFTSSGSITVTFRHLPQDERLEIDVIDTGKGISEEGLKRIFLPFEQEHNGDCRCYQGIGLGLALCKEIAELHDGSLRVQSVLGKGSTFTVSLPCDTDMGTVDVRGESLAAGCTRRRFVKDKGFFLSQG